MSALSGGPSSGKDLPPLKESGKETLQESGRAPQRLETVAAWGLLPRGMWLLTAVLILPAPAAAYLWGAGPTGTAVVAASAILCVAVLAKRTVKHLGSDVAQPILLALEAVREIRRGKLGYRLPESGAPLLRELAESLNAAGSAAGHRNQMSRANLVSAEAAFERIHSVLQSLIEGVILIDDEAKVVLANPCARRLFQGKGGPIEGRELLSMLTGELCERVQQGLASLRDEEREQVRMMGLEAEGRVFDVSIVRVRSTPAGNAAGSVIAFVDVTRNHEISRLKDQFLSSVSHELRTPLTNICAFTEILGQVSPDDEKDWREFLTIVTTESQRLKGLVDDILEHSRLHTDQTEWTLEPIQLGELVTLVVEIFAKQAAQQKIELSCSIAGERALLVLGDRERIHEVLTRLLDNALKFTPEDGQVRVEVSGLDDSVEVAIGGSGKGVPLEDRETIFEPFHQVGDHLTEKPPGTGLGLAICRGFIDGMGGAIWCEESELGGAKFRFALPAASDAIA